jgi:hypothetical protein
MNIKYQNLIEKLEPFIISYEKHLGQFEKLSNNKEIKAELMIDPLKLESKEFIELIYKMDKLTFGGQGMGMPKWVMFDCAVMPGAVFGFAISKNKLSKSDLEMFGDVKGEYIPVSMYIAIPMIEKGSWFGHNLSSLNNIVSEKLSGLGLLTKYSAMKFLRITSLYGATQWESNALHIHLQIGDLVIKSAYTPIHSNALTLCYKCTPLPEEIVFGESRISHLESNNLFHASEENIIQLQVEIENGNTFIIRKRPLIEINKNIFEIQKS